MATGYGGGTAVGAQMAAGAADHRGVGCDALVSFGLAGGLDPTLRPGTLIVPSAVIAGDSEGHATDQELSRLLGGATTWRARSLGADAVVGSVEEKRRLHGRTPAAAAIWKVAPSLASPPARPCRSRSCA